MRKPQTLLDLEQERNKEQLKNVERFTIGWIWFCLGASFVLVLQQMFKVIEG